MIKESYIYEEKNWDKPFDLTLDSQNTLIICFGSTELSDIQDGLDLLTNSFSNSNIIGCSTSGEIKDEMLYEKSLVVMVIKFQSTTLKLSSQTITNSDQSFQIGENISKNLLDENLKAIFILADGLNTNGSTLTKGLNKNIANNIVITGGLAGDDANFAKTWVLANGKPLPNHIVAVGFYGDNFRIAYGSQGGWKKFGIDRVVTKSQGNVLYELDNKPALEIYKTYLGESSNELPFSGLLYPLMIKETGDLESKVRTILAVNEDEQSITFAGDIPNNSEVMFMRASFAELIAGALEAGEKLKSFNYQGEVAVNIAISCVGRKLVLAHKTEDELEVVHELNGENIEQIGYYSYGELSPLANGFCDLHNQTMTITRFWEIEPKNEN